MEHRHLLHTSPAYEMDHNESRNRIQSSMNFGTAGPSEEAFAFHTETMRPLGAIFSSRSSLFGTNEYIPAGISMEASHPRSYIPGPSYVPFQHPSSSRSFCPGTQIYPDRPSSSHHSASSSSDYGLLVHGYEVATASSANGRGPYKRRRTIAPVVHEQVRYHSGSSSGMSLPFIQKPSAGSGHWPWEVVSVTSSDRGNGLSMGGEASQRNVRIRSNFDLDVSQSRDNVLSYPPRYSDSALRSSERVGATELANLGVSANAQERSYIHSDDRTRMAAGPIAFAHDANQFRPGGSGTTSSSDINNHRPGQISSRNTLVPLPYIHISGSQTVRGSHSSYFQRAIPPCRVTRGYMRPGYIAPSVERVLQSVPDSYSSSYSRPLSATEYRNSDWSRRLRTHHRSGSLSSDARDRLGFMMLEHSTLYDSRNLLDQHRDMRLDVDNMSYEELLALEERIGNVSTGLSEDRMSNCLRERVHYASDESEEESNCVICLEEYKNKDTVGTLANCGHDYHTGCIKKWLSMKKVCPICKAPVVADS